MFKAKTVLTVSALAAVSILGLAGCSSDAMDTKETTKATTEMSATPEASADAEMDALTANLVGSGCAAYAEAVPSGDGSIVGMSTDPVAVAASNNPLLTTLVAAVSGQLNPDVNLVDTLNGSEFTVFAPVDDAFAKIDAATIETLKTDSDMLTSILTYHVVPGQIMPADIDGEHKTVNGASVTVTGSGDNIMVDDSKVICGGVQTANATVYLVDSVLMPK